MSSLFILFESTLELANSTSGKLDETTLGTTYEYYKSNTSRKSNTLRSSSTLLITQRMLNLLTPNDLGNSVQKPLIKKVLLYLDNCLVGKKANKESQFNFKMDQTEVVSLRISRTSTNSCIGKRFSA